MSALNPFNCHNKRIRRRSIDRSRCYGSSDRLSNFPTGRYLSRPPDFSDIGAIPPMNAMEILRVTARILRTDPSTFMTIPSLLIFPVSTALLSNFLIDQAIVSALGRRLMLLVVTSGLPPTHFVKQIFHHLAGTIVSSSLCFPFLITFLLLARACIAYSFVVLVDSVMSAVFYFTCRSSGMEVLSGNALAVEELERLSFESASVG